MISDLAANISVFFLVPTAGSDTHVARIADRNSDTQSYTNIAGATSQQEATAHQGGNHGEFDHISHNLAPPPIAAIFAIRGQRRQDP